METIKKESALDYSKGEIVMYQPDDTIQLEVRVENDSVWLNRQQISDLFSRDIKTISKHINNALSEELEDEPVVAKFATTASDGKKYQVEFFNLDMILSVGYRVKSKQGVKFRKWANKILKQYLLKGYVINQRMIDIEKKVGEQGADIAELKKQVEFFVRSSLPPVEGVFYDGQIFDAYIQIANLIKLAKVSVVLVDNYIDESTLLMLSKRSPGVTATIYTRQLTPQQQLDLSRHNLQYPPINNVVCLHNHDRFLIIDDVPYMFGASLKDAGKKLFAYIKMKETSASEILGLIR
jgi:acylphosphatase